jgi:hypothetical protein
MTNVSNARLLASDFFVFMVSRLVFGRTQGARGEGETPET